MELEQLNLSRPLAMFEGIDHETLGVVKSLSSGPWIPGFQSQLGGNPAHEPTSPS
jgi:hypothetical protein